MSNIYNINNNEDIVLSQIGSPNQLQEYISDPIIYLINIIYEDYGIGPASDYKNHINQINNDLFKFFSKIITYFKDINKFDESYKKSIIDNINALIDKFKLFFKGIYKNKFHNKNEMLIENLRIQKYLKEFIKELKDFNNLGSINKNLILKSNNNNITKNDFYLKYELKWKIRKYWVNYFLDNHSSDSGFLSCLLLRNDCNPYKKLLKNNNMYNSMKRLENDVKMINNNLNYKKQGDDKDDFFFWEIFKKCNKIMIIIAGISFALYLKN